MSTFLTVMLIILIVLVVALVVLYFLGRRLQKKQEAQQEQMEAAKQTVTMLIIDKKMMRLKDSGLPQVVIDQTPKLMRRNKLPIVKAKVGPRIMSFMADAAVFDVIPLKTECKVVISGLYITELKSARGGIPQVQKKKTLRDRISGMLGKKN